MASESSAVINEILSSSAYANLGKRKDDVARWPNDNHSEKQRVGVVLGGEGGGGRHIMTSLWTLVKNHWSEVDRGVLWKPGRHLMSHLHERLQQSRYLLTHTSLISTGPFCLFKLMLVEHTFFFFFFLSHKGPKKATGSYINMMHHEKKTKLF